MATKTRTLSDLNDLMGFIVLAAHGKFPKVGPFTDDQEKNLMIAFEKLEGDLPLVEKKVRDPAQFEHLKQMLRDALAAYQQGDKKKGAHLLQDFQNIVFPNRFKEYEERKGDHRK